MSVKKKKITLSNVPTKVPIPDRIMAIEGKEKWKQAVRLWWYGDGVPSYAARYEGYVVIKIENGFVYMQREE